MRIGKPSPSPAVPTGVPPGEFHPPGNETTSPPPSPGNPCVSSARSAWIPGAFPASVPTCAYRRRPICDVSFRRRQTCNAPCSAWRYWALPICASTASPSPLTSSPPAGRIFADAAGPGPTMSPASSLPATTPWESFWGMAGMPVMSAAAGCAIVTEANPGYAACCAWNMPTDGWQPPSATAPGGRPTVPSAKPTCRWARSTMPAATSMDGIAPASMIAPGNRS